ncbi:MAG: competence protein ComEA [Moraxellaceae bacterium]|jgi:competence protein ComEA|nr:competence protein ComEA [Moraxellaceae bacterium]
MNLKAITAAALFALTLPLAHAAEPAEAAPAKPAAATVPAAARINVNTADVLTLTGLKGVGEKKAQAIISYRKQNGPFNSLEQLEAVPGIGPSIIAKNKNLIVFR